MVNLDSLLAYACNYFSTPIEFHQLERNKLIVDTYRRLYQLDLTVRLPTGQRQTLTFIQKFTFRKSEVRTLETLLALPPTPGIPRLIDAAIDATAPEDKLNDKLTQWFVTPFYPGSPLTFTDEVPATIINALARVHAYFATRLHELPALYETVNATTFRHTFDQALGILAKAQRENPHVIFEDAYRCITSARDNLLLYKALATLPLTLTHGDVHPGNMLVAADGQATLIDWGNARIAPAMLDIANMITIDSPSWECYLAAWTQASGDALNPALARLGYDWATIMINAFYLPYAVDFTPPENVQGMIERLHAAEQRIAHASNSTTIDKAQRS